MIRDPAVRLDLPQINRQFEDMESSIGLFEKDVCGVRYWKLIRFGIHSAICSRHAVHDSIRAPRKRLGLRGLSRYLFNVFVKAPYRTGRCDVLFLGHPRRIKGGGGYWQDVYCDPLIAGLGLNAVVLEHSHNARHALPAKTERLFYLDFMGAIGRIVGLVRHLRFSTQQKRELTELQDELERRFSLGIDVVALVRSTVGRHIFNRRVYRRLIRRASPKCILMTVSYGNEAMVEAAKDVGVTIAELQHGTMYRGHYGYTFPVPPPVSLGRYFPDVFLAFGEFWGRQCPLPIPGTSVLPVGFPHFEIERRKFAKAADSRTVLFISQKTIGRRLADFATRFSELVAGRFDVVYKLHPHEYEGWKTRYGRLADSRVRVVSGEESLYSLFASALAQVGVYSTALYEGIAFGCPALLVNLPGADAMEGLVAEGFAERINRPEELWEKLEHGVTLPVSSGERIFRNGWEDNFRTALARLGVKC